MTVEEGMLKKSVFLSEIVYSPSSMLITDEDWWPLLM